MYIYCTLILYTHVFTDLEHVLYVQIASCKYTLRWCFRREMQAVFCRERNWDQFHTPRNVLLALVGEVGELAEILWVFGIQLIKFKLLNWNNRKRVKSTNHLVSPGEHNVPQIFWKNIEPRVVKWKQSYFHVALFCLCFTVSGKERLM